MKLSKLNVQELSTNEMRKTEGGLYPILLLGIIAYMAGFSYYASKNPSK